MKYFILIHFFLFLSCSTIQPKKNLVPASTQDKKQYVLAQKYREKKNDKKTIEILTSLTQKNNGTDVYIDSLYLLGTIHFEQKKYKEAYTTFIKIIDSKTENKRTDEAHYLSALSLYYLGQLDESLSLLNELEIEEIEDVNFNYKIYKLYLNLYTQTNDHLGVLKSLVAIGELNIPEKSQYRTNAISYVENQLTESELKQVIKKDEFGWIVSHAKLKYGLILYDKQIYDEAIDLLLSVESELKGSEASERALSILDQIRARNRVNPNIVGAVLPLTGKHASMGHRALKAIELGLGVVGSNKSEIGLAVVDSEGNSDVAKKSVQRLVLEDNVIAIIGSLLSKTALSVAEESEKLGVPAIGLSQKTGVTEYGTNIFLNSITNQMQIEHLVKYAIYKLGYKRFAILYPNDAFGVEYANLFWESVLTHGGTVRGAQIYPPNETDFSGPVQRLVGKFYLEDRADEYKTLLKKWQETQPKHRRGSPPEELLKPIIDFDAVFIADGPKALGQIAPMLAYHDVTGVRLLGPNLWNTNSIIKRGQKYVENSIFVDSIVFDDKDFSESFFYKEFQTVFGEPPGIFEVQAYDTATILRKIINSGAVTREEVKNRLTEIKRLPGVLGTLHVKENREIERPLAILTIQNGVIKKID